MTEIRKLDGEYPAPRKTYDQMDINERINIRSNVKPTVHFYDLPIFKSTIDWFNTTGAIYGYSMPAINLHYMYRWLTAKF